MTPANIFEKVSVKPETEEGFNTAVWYVHLITFCPQVKTSEFYRYSRQLRQEVDQALSYFHDVNRQPLVESHSNRIRSVRPQTAVFRGMIGHSMVNSKILLLQRPKVSVWLVYTVSFCYRLPLTENTLFKEVQSGVELVLNSSRSFVLVSVLASLTLFLSLRYGGSLKGLRCRYDPTAWQLSTTLPFFWAEKNSGPTVNSTPPPKFTATTLDRTHGYAWLTCLFPGQRKLDYVYFSAY